jgi:Ulp1 protease family, C-terminal catalytic domain
MVQRQSTPRNKKRSRSPKRRSSTYISPRACSPLRKDTFKHGDFSTCYTYEALQKIRTAYNKTAPVRDKIPPRRTKKGIWNAIKEKIDNMSDCDGEWCWIEQPFMKNIDNESLNSIKDMTFKPPIPKGKYDWLSTDDIDRVLRQYTKMHPEFYFMGTWPMDFAQLHSKFSKFDPAILESKGKTKVGLVLNEDNSNQPGSHWVGMYMMLPERQVQFFDSYGNKPMAPVCEWISTINRKIKSIGGKSFTVLWNPHRHQYANSECGVYTLNFLINRLEGKSFKSIVNNQIRDEQMNKKRNSFFNPFHKYDNTIYGGGLKNKKD